MTKHPDSNVPSYDHDELIILIPWYVKGKLTADENAAVKQHLTDCEICRNEVTNCNALADFLPVTAESWQPSSAHFAGILDEVDKLEAKKKLGQSANTVLKTGFFNQLVEIFTQTPRLVRWTLTVESLAFAILAAVMIFPGRLNTDHTRVFETLSNADTPALSSGLMLKVVFSEDMTTKELSELLVQTKAQIRQGPSVVGAYTLEILAGATDQAETILRTHPRVRLVLGVETNTQKP